MWLHIGLLNIVLLSLVILLPSHVLAYYTIMDILSNDAKFETLIIHLQRTRLVPFINKLDTGTLFAPDNDAFANYHGPPITQDILLYHLIPGMVPSDQLYHHQILETSFRLENYLNNNTGQRILVHQAASSSFGDKTPSYFVNDARLITTDIPVNRKTVIHAVNKVLEPPNMLAPSLESRTTDLYQMMDRVGLVHLINQHQPFTVFYSEQSILEPFNQVEQSYLLSTYGDEDLGKMLDYLVIRGDIYTDDFVGEKEYKTISGEVLQIKVDKKKGEKVITVDGELIEQGDILAANGVLHKVENLPRTKQVAFDIRKYLYGVNATKFVSLLDRYGLGYYLAPGVTNFTVLAPENDSIDEGALPDNLKKAWLSYHIVHGQWFPDQLHDRQLLSSEYKSPQLNDQAQRIPIGLYETRKSSIFFGNARSQNAPITINNNAIYQLSSPMNLPYDVFSSIVVDLELSSFIATLYVSGVVDKIKSASGITLFAPTNQAYKSLGLVATYLVHPTGRQDLQTTLQYHAAQTLLYDHDLRSSAYSVATLTGHDSLEVGGLNEQGHISIGDNGTIHQTNVLMANGVIHKIDTVMVPPSVSLTQHKMLVGMDSHRVLDWFEDFPWLDHNNNDGATVDGGDYILLAPTDRAFTQLDEHLGTGWEKKDRDAYERLVRLHVIPKTQQMDRRTLLGGEIEDYPTLLSNRDRIMIHGGSYFAENFVQVMGQTGKGAHARVLAKGSLRKYAQVIQIDTVLIPVSRGLFGLPWYWSLALVSVLALVGAGLFGWAGYRVWQKRRRAGYESIGEAAEEEEEAERNQDSNHHQGGESSV
ncbi:FAS1 domain-containing protein [Chlamydoabsidia padenii]|nr:FAS1 domain-containing protein [Chlamydoabsidia padenii]